MRIREIVAILLCFRNVYTEDKKFDYNNGEECPPDNEKCEFKFEVENKITMMLPPSSIGEDWSLVFAIDGKLYTRVNGMNKELSEAEAAKVVTADGVERMTVAVNGMVPGPKMIVYEGQEIVVEVTNKLYSDTVTIHWHGMEQYGTPYMDGVGWVTQCPIASGQSFTYRFKAAPAGSHWYHSHVGAQMGDGLFGALIVKKKEERNADMSKDNIMIIGDWDHESATMTVIKRGTGFYDGKEKIPQSEAIDGSEFVGVPWAVGLINGKGRYKDKHTGESTETPLEKFTVDYDETYRFRVIQAGAVYPLRVSVDDHTITVVATDGFEIKPMEVESFIIWPGERYDFELKTKSEGDSETKNFWIRAASIEVEQCEPHEINAILHYSDGDDVEPTTERKYCTTDDPCKIINCPFTRYTIDESTKCILVSDLKSNEENPAPPKLSRHNKDQFLNFGFPPGVNGRTYAYQNSLTEYQQHKCDVGNACSFELDLEYDKTYQMVLSNVGNTVKEAHPIHMHGHSFYVLKMGYPLQNGSLIVEDPYNNPHINVEKCKPPCMGPWYETPTWKDPTWNTKIPGLNEKDPPRKDTLTIPSGGFAVIRIRSDNPGKWFIHCHLEAHAVEGMGLVLNEAPMLKPRQPDGFPVCKNFYNKESTDIRENPNKSKAEKDKENAFSMLKDARKNMNKAKAEKDKENAFSMLKDARKNNKNNREIEVEGKQDNPSMSMDIKEKLNKKVEEKGYSMKELIHMGLIMFFAGLSCILLIIIIKIKCTAKNSTDNMKGAISTVSFHDNNRFTKDHESG